MVLDPVRSDRRIEVLGLIGAEVIIPGQSDLGAAGRIEVEEDVQFYDGMGLKNRGWKLLRQIVAEQEYFLGDLL